MDRIDWFGAKRVVKNVLNLRPVNSVLVGTLRHLPVSSTLARIPVSVAEVEGRAADVRYVLTNPSRCSIAKELFWGRGSRVKPDEQLSLELFAALARRADVVFDIGANTGIFSIIAALSNPATHIEAFEIVPEVFEILFQNVVRNDVASQVTCNFAGVDKDGFTTRVPSTRAHSSLPLSYSAATTAEQGTKVPFSSLDTLCEPVREGSHLLIKIDVEATEATLFAHGWKAVRRLRPWMVCEILVGAPGTQDIARELERHGYKLYKITDRGLQSSNVLQADARFHDWLFAPADIRDLGEVARLTNS